MRSFVDKLEKISEDPELQKSEAGTIVCVFVMTSLYMIAADASSSGSWLGGWANSITSATSYTSNKTNPMTTDGAPATSGQELKLTIKSDNEKDKQTSVVVKKTSDNEEQEDDDHWEDGGWGEEVRTEKFKSIWFF